MVLVWLFHETENDCVVLLVLVFDETQSKTIMSKCAVLLLLGAKSSRFVVVVVLLRLVLVFAAVDGG